ncbi:hypothetical protein JCM9279_004423 [Rhodotorula babjevae]
MLARLSILLAIACALVVASPLPQVVDTPVSTLSVNPAAPSPEVSSSNESSTNSTNPGANISQLLGNLNELQQQNGAGADAVDPDDAPSTAFANFGGDSPAAGGGAQAQGGAAPLGGLLQSIQQATDMTSGMVLETKAGGPTPTSIHVLAVDTTTASDVPTTETFDLNNFLDGASFPAQATTAIPGVVASAA